MSVYSSRRHELRKNLKNIPVLDLCDDDLDDEAEMVFGCTDIGNKRSKGKRDEWADIVDLVECTNTNKNTALDSVLDTPPKKHHKAKAETHQKTSLPIVQMDQKPSSTIVTSAPTAAITDEQLYKELFGELDLSNPKITTQTHTAKLEPHVPTAKSTRAQAKKNSGLKSASKGPVSTQDMLARLDALEYNYHQNGHSNRFESVDLDIETLPICPQLEEEDEIQVKFKYLTSVHRLLMKTNERFFDRLNEIGQLLRITEPAKIRFFLHNEMFTADQTPKSLKLTVGNIIECIVMDNRSATSNGSTMSKGIEDANLMSIKLRDAKAHKRSQITLLKIDKFEQLGKMFAMYAQQKELSLNKIRFEFDGEELEADQTPMDLDMEEDSLIDVIVKSS